VSGATQRAKNELESRVAKRTAALTKSNEDLSSFPVPVSPVTRTVESVGGRSRMLHDFIDSLKTLLATNSRFRLLARWNCKTFRRRIASLSEAD